jgi:hypothetical protein
MAKEVKLRRTPSRKSLYYINLSVRDDKLSVRLFLCASDSRDIVVSDHDRHVEMGLSTRQEPGTLFQNSRYAQGV